MDEGAGEPRDERAWQRFALSWRAANGRVALVCAKAYAHGGATQPEFGRRNAIQRVEVKMF